LQHPVIPSRATALLDAARHGGFAEPLVELPAGLPPLGHLHGGGADADDVANAYVGLRHAHRGDVLAERSGRSEFRPVAKLRPPECVVIRRVMMKRLFAPAMVLAVALFVSGKTGRRNADGSRHGLLAYSAWCAARAERGRPPRKHKVNDEPHSGVCLDCRGMTSEDDAPVKNAIGHRCMSSVAAK